MREAFKADTSTGTLREVQERASQAEESWGANRGPKQSKLAPVTEPCGTNFTGAVKAGPCAGTVRKMESWAGRRHRAELRAETASQPSPPSAPDDSEAEELVAGAQPNERGATVADQPDKRDAGSHKDPEMAAECK